MIKYPYDQQARPSELDTSLRDLIKIVVWIYLILSAAIALLFGVAIVGITIAYCLLRLIVGIVLMLLHKHGGISLQETFAALLQQTKQYYAGRQV
jgi:hypothetical protein